MVGSRLNVHLYRDSFNTPWGFRLQGGKDLNQPLTVQRVFSNSPAEGELQRGDVILSINNRDSSQLTHKQAQDLIKHGGGQVQLVVTRPPPGSHVGPLSPPIVLNKPRAPSLQLVQKFDELSLHERFKAGLHDEDTPVTIDYVRKRLNRLRVITSNNPYQNSPSRPNTITMNQQGYNPSFNPSMGDQRPPHQPVHQSLHVQVIPSPQRQRTSFSQPPTTPTPTTPIPPWAAQQFEPKRVSKLSKLGGGGLGFGTDYATLPRRSSSAQYGGRLQNRRTSSDVYDGPQQTEPDRLATGPPPRVCNLRKLGGGGFDFGTSFGTESATLPRRSTGRRLSQPPSMPGGTGYGHMPTKVSLTRLGGGGPEFGSDFSKGGGVGYGQTPAQRVHTSLDNITLSPRTPEVNVSSPFYQPFEPQASSYQPAAPSYQPSGPAYQPTSPAYQPMSPTYQPYQSPPQQMYTPTGLLLEQQRLQEQQQEEGEAIVPVWERRKQFQAGPAAPTAVRTPGNKPPPKIPKPKPGPTQYSNFGTDYGSQQKKPGSSWRPAPVFKPTPAPVAANPVASYTPSPASVQYAPRPAAPAPAAPAPPPQQAPAYSPQQAWQGAEDERTPAWRSSLKSTGVKPWEEDVPYAIPQEPKRSGQFKPTPAPQAAPYSPPQPKVVDGSAGGPKVVHLQYNSPMGLYSNQNVEETLKGQTQAMAGQSSKQAPTNESGERDWSQSKVLKFINEQEARKGRPGPPKVAPKPQVSPGLPQQHQQSGYFDEIAASDF